MGTCWWKVRGRNLLIIVGNWFCERFEGCRRGGDFFFLFVLPKVVYS